MSCVVSPFCIWMLKIASMSRVDLPFLQAYVISPVIKFGTGVIQIRITTSHILYDVYRRNRSVVFEIPHVIFLRMQVTIPSGRHVGITLLIWEMLDILVTIGVTHSWFAFIIAAAISSPQPILYFPARYCVGYFGNIDISPICSIWFFFLRRGLYCSFAPHDFRFVIFAIEQSVQGGSLLSQYPPGINSNYQCSFSPEASLDLFIHYIRKFSNRASGRPIFTLQEHSSSFLPTGCTFQFIDSFP